MIRSALALALTALIASCGGSDGAQQAPPSSSASGDEHADAHEAEEEHAHDETPLGTVVIGEHTVQLAQGHGALVAGAEGHLVVRLPYSDSGATVVRAWIGTEDRTLSYVGLGQYAGSHDDYDVHATAPDPLPAGVQWWIELEQPDGAVLTGSAQALLE